MVYKLKKTSQFKSSLKLAKKRGLEMSLLEDIVEKLRTDKPLEQRNHNHELSGVLKGVWECHIKPDWLLLYYKDEDVLTLTLVDTGSHSDIFNN